MRPCTRFGRLADSRVMARAAPHSICALMRVLPDSRMIQSIISSRRSSKIFTASSSTRARSAGAVVAHSRWLSRALR